MQHYSPERQHGQRNHHVYAMSRWLAALLLLCGIARADTVRSLPIFVEPLPTTCGAVCPYGVPAPSGFHWVLTIEDEFTQDTSLNTSLWSNGSTPDTIYFDSNGLNIQPTSASNSCSAGQSCAAGIGSTFSPRYGFWEWSVKWPRTNDGTGDGYHYDTYINNNVSTDRTGYQEVGIGEVVFKPGADEFTDFYCCGNSTNGDPTVYAHLATNSPCCLSNNFHTIGVWWDYINPGTGNGSVSSYFDGSPLYTDGAQGTWWGSGGAQINMNNIACNQGGCDGTTATSGNPLTYQYFRYWVLAPN
jgi:hypothetical protein